MVSKSKKLYPFNFLRLYVLFITYLKISVTFSQKKCMKWAKISILLNSIFKGSILTFFGKFPFCTQ